MSLLLLCLLLCSISLCIGEYIDEPCKWSSKSGASFDLTALEYLSEPSSFKAYPYTIIDGDIPCTPETEPSYGYTFNFCESVPSEGTPNACKKLNKAGVVLQWIDISGVSDCYVIGKYDSSQDDIYYSLYDSNDPSKGVSLKYPQGEKCTSGKVRTATLDIECANIAMDITHADEETSCDYHVHMKSYHGCPTQCPITSKGLCSSHGHFAYDEALRAPRCYCNQGWSEKDCNTHVYGSTGEDYSIEIGLLVILLLVCISLILVISFMAYKVWKLRKEHHDYNTLPTGTEMVETLNF